MSTFHHPLQWIFMKKGKVMAEILNKPCFKIDGIPDFSDSRILSIVFPETPTKSLRLDVFDN